LRHTNPNHIFQSRSAGRHQKQAEEGEEERQEGYVEGARMASEYQVVDKVIKEDFIRNS